MFRALPVRPHQHHLFSCRVWHLRHLANSDLHRLSVSEVPAFIGRLQIPDGVFPRDFGWGILPNDFCLGFAFCFGSWFPVLYQPFFRRLADCSAEFLFNCLLCLVWFELFLFRFAVSAIILPLGLIY